MKTKELQRFIEKERQADINRSFSFHSWVSVKHKYVCMTIPKVACSTVKATLHYMEGHPIPESLGDVHVKGTRLLEFSNEEITEMLVAEDWFRFCFVRNPYYRLLSAYKSKIGNMWAAKHEPYYSDIQQEIRETYGYPVRDGRPAGVVAFRDFVRFIQTPRNPKSRDGHWNVQTNILMLPAIDYDFIGRFENFAQDFTRVLAHLNATAEVLAVACKIRNPTVKVHHALAYDKELADSVYQTYQVDFENFGYSRDSWMFDYE